MARDGSGTYTRVEGPYVNGNVADADEVNAELDDIADALTDSINIAGTKAFGANQSMGGNKLTDLAAPTNANDAARKAYVDSAITAAAQPLDATLTALAALSYTSGTLYITMTAADTFALADDATLVKTTGTQSVGGAKTLTNTLTISNTLPILQLTETDGPADAKNWSFEVSGGNLVLRTRDDSLANPVSVFLFTRSGTSVTDLNITATALRHNSVAVRVAGKTAVPIPASAMVPNTTNGAAIGSTETTTNKVMVRTLDFDTTTQEGAQFSFPMPKGWNESTVTFEPIWTADSGSGTVVFELRGVALSNDDALDTAFGTGQTSTDTLITAGDVHIGPESSAITIGGTPAEGDIVFFQIRRVPASDTLGVDARLIGIRLFITTNSANDA